MIKAVLFDIDGTLIDSFHRNLEFYRQIFTAAGIPNFPSEEEYRPTFHMPLLDCFRHLSPDKSPQEIDRLFQVSKNLDYVQDEFILMPDVRTMLDLLNPNFQLGIVTGRQQLAMAEFLEETKLESFFDTAIHRGLYEHPKPNPEAIQLALGELDIQPEEVVYIGDAQVDIDAAHNAKCKAILYRYDHTGNHVVKNADGYLESYLDLPKILESL